MRVSQKVTRTLWEQETLSLWEDRVGLLGGAGGATKRRRGEYK